MAVAKSAHTWSAHPYAPESGMWMPLLPHSREQLSFASRGRHTDLNLALAREFKTLSSLHHPHIIGVLDYGFDQQRCPYFTMRLLDELRTLALVRGVLVLRGQGVSEGGGPYPLWREVVRWLALTADLATGEAGAR